MGARDEWYDGFFEGLALEMWSAGFSAAETARDVAFLADELALRPGARLLDVPCGNGRHLRAFAARGFRVRGIDLAAGFTEPLARDFANATNVEIVRADLRRAELGGPFDGAYCWGNSFGYLRRDEDAALLRRIGAALRPGARFALQTSLVAEAAVPNFSERHWEQAGDIFVLMDCAYDARESRIDAVYTYIRGADVEVRPLSLCVYTLAELGALLREAGLTPIAAYGSREREAFELGAREAIVVAEKMLER
jgi:SAM-dependent methyltransferase